MSTRALREALERMRQEAEAAREWGTVNLAVSAQAELEAIEQAARQVAAWAEVGVEDTPAQVMDKAHAGRVGMRVLARIVSQVDSRPGHGHNSTGTSEAKEPTDA